MRSWNLFHGNTVPPQRRAFLEEMVALATADEPDVLCVQEVPAWALRSFTVGDVAARPPLGPLPIGARAGKALTELHHGVLRSAFAGQGNAIRLAPRLHLLEHRCEALNPRRFRDAQARTLGLGLRRRLAWAKERRVVQLVRFADGAHRFALANLHATSSTDGRLPDAEVLRAAELLRDSAEGGDVLVLAGDLNVWPDLSNTLRALTSEKWGFSAPGPGIDHVLVRGAAVSAVRVWPPERRAVDGRLLSDHAPVEIEVEVE